VYISKSYNFFPKRTWSHLTYVLNSRVAGLRDLIIMCKKYKELSDLPVENQHLILKELCKRWEPIEIDNNVYLIPPEVNQLIDSLIIQLEDLTTFKPSNFFGKEKN